MPFRFRTAYKALSIFLSTAAAILTAGCSPLKTLNALIPEDGFRVHKGIAYGTHQRQQLDVYVPAKPGTPTGKLPLVIFFYGGSWDSGDRVGYKFVAEALTSKGYVTVIPDYRVYPEVKFPEFLYDAAKAVKWAKLHASDYGADPDRLFLVGHSAGAHIAAMLALDEQYLASENMKPGDLQGVVGLAGPYDFLPLKSARLKDIFGPDDEHWKSQPINFVSEENPPMLLLVGLQDATVWPRNSYRLFEEIKNAGGTVLLEEFPDYGHIDMVVRLAKPFRKDGALLNEISDFIQQH